MTDGTARGYMRLASLFQRWCGAVRLPFRFDYPQLASWCYMYSLKFTQRTLGAHLAAFKWFADLQGLQWPAPDSSCMRRLARVRRALRLRDPSVEQRSFALTNNWLVSMMAFAGLRRVRDMYTCPLDTLAFWVRVRVAHFAMMRLCEHESGMLRADVQYFQSARRPDSSRSSAGFFTLRVGYLLDGVAPLAARNRKLKLRLHRSPVLPVWEDVSSPGQILLAWLRRVHNRQPTTMLFPDVIDGRVCEVPLSGDAFLRRLRALARAVGMPPDDVARIECRSLRAGGCTDFFAMRVARDAIMLQGGWSSDTVDIYNRPSAFHRWASFAPVVPRFGSELS